MWLPARTALKNPLYKSLAAQLAEDVRAGRVRDGERLPTHRELADHLGVTVGTITRAYAEAAELGLIDATVGRGTFVRGKPKPRPRLLDLTPPGFGNLAMNRPALGPHGGALADTLREIADSGALDALLDYVSPAGSPAHREAGARFFAKLGHDVPADRVLVTCGAQNALGVLVSALTEPGDGVLVEELTYGGILAAAQQAHVAVRGVPIDEHGMRADALDAECKKKKARLLICVPNHHNPTSIVMPEARRRQIADVARAHQLLVVEDDVYGFLVRDRPPPIATFYPEGTCTITCTSKALVPGLRIGYVAAPASLVERIVATIRTTVWMAPPLMAEVAARWIDDGTAETLMEFQRSETEARQAIATEYLARFRPSQHPSAFHLWLPLPEQWRSGSFVTALRDRGVMVAASEAFVVGDAPVPRAVRLCVTGPATHEQLRHALAIVRSTLEGAPEVGMGTI
ncbi:MAG TPA: PLP-dependent aminotransferase family protein [Polyangiaceae bacterium]|jgi:DNA-binding transcriptional MocR family regulator|nr:PLP-dependent aminotransferase family protein [Polyangiaceae bacterium]